MARSDDPFNAACDVGCVHAGTTCCGFENRSYRIAVKARAGHAAVTIDSAKDRAFGYVGGAEIFAKRPDRTRLVVIAKRDRDLVVGLLLIGF